MITSTIGKIFLEAYNKKYSTDYDAKTFFVEVYYPLFFGNSKYLQWIQNSPFVQGLVSTKSGEKGVLLKDENDKSFFSSEDAISQFIKDEKNKISDDDIIEKKKENNKYKVIRRLKSYDFQSMLDTFISKVESCKVPDASIALGYPASEEKEYATTSGQVTNIQLKTDTDDIYLSWFGASLGIEIEKGLSLLFPVAEILLDLFEGWNLYRKVLNENSKLKGNKINSWNGQWIVHRYDEKSFYQDSPMANFNPLVTNKDEGGLAVGTQSWLKVIVKIAQHFQNPQMMCYVYRLDKTNTTIGFIPLNLEHIRKPFELYKILFGIDEGDKAETLWSPEYAFKICCQKGAIGIEAMKPNGLEKYIKDGVKKVKYDLTDEEQKISFHTYQIWLLVMLNNKELLSKAENFSKILFKYSKSADRGKKEANQKIEDILSSRSRMKFLETLTVLIPSMEQEDKNAAKEIGVILNEMPAENVQYFLTLLKFSYTLIKS